MLSVECEKCTVCCYYYILALYPFASVGSVLFRAFFIPHFFFVSIFLFTIQSLSVSVVLLHVHYTHIQTHILEDPCVLFA